MTRTIRMKDIAGLKANTQTAPFVTTEPAKIGGLRGEGSVPVDPPPIDGSLIFDADFDNITWRAQHAGQRYRWHGYNNSDGDNGIIAANNIPPGWDFYETNERWHPDGDKHGANIVVGSEPVGEITGRHGSHRGPSLGKSLVIYDESYGGQSQWGSDCVFIKELDTEYQELVMDFHLKFQPGWAFADQINGSGISKYKIARFGRIRPETADTDSRFSFFGEGPYDQWYILDLKSWTDGGSTWARIQHLIIANPWGQAPAYSGETEHNFAQGWASPEETFADGQWHKWRIRAKMNSEAGVADGELQLWMDDVEQHFANDIEWNTDPADNGNGFNCLSVGGNANNIPYAESEQHEQWFAISGVKYYSGLPD